MDKKLPKIIVIVGHTASGKSDLAIKLAKRFNGEIVSADSRQIYRGMDIGTAKPQLETSGKKQETRISKSMSHVSCLMSQNIPHHLINIKNPNEDYTVAEYKKDAIKAINKIIKKGKLPILVGGTGLYIKAVTENLEIPSVKPNPALRRKLEKRIEKESLESLYRELVEQDPEAAYIVDAKNPRRIIRALEIAVLTKKPFSAQRRMGKKLFDFLKIGIKLPNPMLHKRIEKRTDEMIKNGLVKEVSGLIKKYGDKQIAFDAIGYKEIIGYLDGKISLDETSNLIKKNTNNFAKRQLTWFRKDKDIKWIENQKQAFDLMQKFIFK